LTAAQEFPQALALPSNWHFGWRSLPNTSIGNQAQSKWLCAYAKPESLAPPPRFSFRPMNRCCLTRKPVTTQKIAKKFELIARVCELAVCAQARCMHHGFLRFAVRANGAMSVKVAARDPSSHIHVILFSSQALLARNHLQNQKHSCIQLKCKLVRI
jgi:hypothetical protein